MAEADAARPSGDHKFEVLLYTYFSGWTGFAYDEEDHEVAFNTVEEAIEDLQEAFDVWSQQVRDGEREADQSYDPSDFAIRCATTADMCGVKLRDGRVKLNPASGVVVEDRSEFSKINESGRFGRN